MTVEQTALVNQILNNLRRNVASLERQLASDTSGYVFVWSKHWLGVKFDADNCRAVAVDLATVVRRSSDPRVFTNGNDERAILMDRATALNGALVHGRKMLAVFEDKLMAA